MRTFTPRKKIEQFRIDNEYTAEMWGLPGLARAAGTEFSPVFPIFVVLLGGKPVGYYYATPHVVVRPTVPPDLMTRREFYEVAKTVIAVSRRSFGNPLWFVDPKSDLASPDLLSKLGLMHKDLEVFEVD
jgi:hypothetical protein